jgi:hypothetical protein
MQTRNGNLIIADLVGSIRQARHQGLQQEMRHLGSGWGDKTGEPRRTEVTEADGPSILAEVVAMPEVQGVEKVCARG